MAQTVQTWLQKARYYSGLAGLYAVTFGGGWWLFFGQPQHIALAQSAPPLTAHIAQSVEPPVPEFILHSGKPVRIIVNDAAIDLPVHDGYYDESTGAWTLDDSNAFFAMPTMLANNHSGMTLVYGHGTDAVFSRLATTPFIPGASTVEVHTDTNERYVYQFESARDAVPHDVSIFTYEGPPILVLQTCTGAFSEWRSLYIFRFILVEPLP